jgi:uncharacterized membrane protein
VEELLEDAHVGASLPAGLAAPDSTPTTGAGCAEAHDRLRAVATTTAGVASTSRFTRLRHLHPAELVLALAIAVWIITFAVLVVRRQERFWSVDFDMGIYDQAIWLLARGQSFITVRGLPVFGHHATFGLLLFAPASWLGADPNFLNVFQVAVLALGAVPLYLLGRARALGQWAAAALAGAFLLHPALQFLGWELFHPESIAVTPLLCAYLCAVRRSWRWFAVWIVLAVSFKEDLALAVVVLGLVIAFRPHRRPGDRRAGLVTAVLAALWFLAVTLLLIPTVAGHPAHYEALYAGVGGSPWGVVETAVTDPGEITSRVLSSESGDFAWKLLAPFGLTALLSPGALAVGLPQFGADVLSDTSWTREISYHYAALPLAAVAIAAVEGVAFLVRRVGGVTRWLVPAGVLTCALSASLAWGPSPIGAEYREQWWPPDQDTRLDSKRAAIDAVPDDASVSAAYTFVPHLSGREEIYTFPNPWRPSNWGYQDRNTRDPRTVDWLVVDRVAVGEADQLLLDQILTSGAWDVLRDADGIVVAKRNRT